MEESSKGTQRIRGLGIGLLCFALGSALTAASMRIAQVRADNSRLFELRVYHAVPGKLPALESRFRDTTSKLLAKHNLNVVGYWTVPEDSSPAWNNTFIFMLAHSNLDEAKKQLGCLRRRSGVSGRRAQTRENGPDRNKDRAHVYAAGGFVAMK